MGPFLKNHVKPIGMNIVDGWMDGIVGCACKIEGTL
jgi:hypothetical protein